MLLPQSDQSETAEMINGRSQRAFTLSLTMAILSGIMTVSTILAPARPDPTYISIILIGIVSLVAFASAFLSRRGRTTEGILALLLAINLSFPVFITRTEGLGFLAGLLVVVISVGFALQTLPPKIALRASVVGLAVGVLTILADSFWPLSRPAVPDWLQWVSIGMGTAVFLLIVILISRNFANYSLNAKLISATALVATIAVVSITILIGRFTRYTLTQEIGNNLVGLAQAQALNIGQSLTRELNSLEVLTINKFIQESIATKNDSYIGNNAAILAELRQRDVWWIAAEDDSPFITTVLEHPLAVEILEFQDLLPHHAEIFITDRYGGLIAATNRTSDYYQADENWWQEAYANGQGSIYISSPVFEQSSNTLAIILAVPLFEHHASGSGEVIGILRTSIRLEAIADILDAVSFGETGRADLFFPNNVQIVNDPSGVILQESTPEKIALIHTLQNSEQHFISDDYDGSPSLITFATVNTLGREPYIDGLGWPIIVHQDQAEALAAANNQQRLQLLLGVGVVLAAVGVAAVVGQRLSGPITRLTGLALQIASGDLQARAEVETKDEVGSLALAFNSMADQLQEIVGSLEQRVATRTQAIVTSAEVGRRLSTILHQPELVREVVNQIRQAFQYYHVHIYLYDSREEKLIMAGGTGKAGQELLARDHAIQKGQGLVGQAAITNSIVLVPDVSQAQDWLPNPLLPDTKAEVAVPIRLGERVLGVLDVQHNVIDGLQQEDADLLQSIANQVAIALQNAQQYEAAQARTEQVTRLTAVTQEIQATATVEEALQVAVRELGRMTGAGVATVQLLPERKKNGQEEVLS